MRYSVFNIGYKFKWVLKVAKQLKKYLLSFEFYYCDVIFFVNVFCSLSEYMHYFNKIKQFLRRNIRASKYYLQYKNLRNVYFFFIICIQALFLMLLHRRFRQHHKQLNLYIQHRVPLNQTSNVPIWIQAVPNLHEMHQRRNPRQQEVKDLSDLRLKYHPNQLRRNKDERNDFRLK